MTEHDSVAVTSPVDVEQRGPVLVVTINRPQARNALNADVAAGISRAMDLLDRSPGLRVGVLTGAGGVFSAGMDLKGFVDGTTPFIEGRGLCGLTVTPPRKPLIAAVEGWAVAGGFELLLACDLVVASRRAQLGVPEVKRGLVAAAGGALLLPKRLPLALALEMLLTGDPITAERAYELGLVNHLTAAGEALDGALALASRIAENAPLAVAVSKEIARSADDWGTSDGWVAQDELAKAALESEDALEGATAFAERRDPVWRGV